MELNAVHGLSHVILTLAVRWAAKCRAPLHQPETAFILGGSVSGRWRMDVFENRPELDYAAQLHADVGMQVSVVLTEHALQRQMLPSWKRQKVGEVKHFRLKTPLLIKPGFVQFIPLANSKRCSRSNDPSKNKTHLWMSTKRHLHLPSLPTRQTQLNRNPNNKITLRNMDGSPAGRRLLLA